MGSAVGDGRRALSKEVPVGYKRTEMEVFGATAPSPAYRETTLNSG